MIVLTGKSGVGKSSVEKELTNFGFNRIIQYTTRTPRNNETNGNDYYFVSHDKFTDMLNKGMFVRYKNYGMDYYGTLLKDCHHPRSVISLGEEGCLQIIEAAKNFNIFVALLTTDNHSRLKKIKDRSGLSDQVLSRFNREANSVNIAASHADIIVNNDRYSLSPNEVAQTIYKAWKNQQQSA